VSLQQSCVENLSPKRAEQVLPESKGVREEEKGSGGRGRDAPNNVCTYEQMNTQFKKSKKENLSPVWGY
jgi:hypothetical protein